MFNLYMRLNRFDKLVLFDHVKSLESQYVLFYKELHSIISEGGK